MDRYLEQIIIDDLKKKLVILVGPRQVGKTWLAKKIMFSYKNPSYLNYDNLKDKNIILNQSWLPSTDLLIFDELHKMPQWKNYLKGVYDTRPDSLHILLTGSARLDTFRHQGDSLLGRFFIHHLLPFCPSEIMDMPLEKFIERGGFPEPVLAESSTDAKRWRNQYMEGIIRDDILDFENVHNFKTLKTLLEMLRQRVGSPLSFKSIAEDLQVAPNTVKKYIGIFESLFIIFRITPYSKNIARSLLKEPKIYFFDTGLVKGDDGLRFENLTAVSLLKHCYTSRDVFGENRTLHYLRTKDGREVDFCIVDDDKISYIVEAKLQDDQPSKSLHYFKERYQLKAVQLTAFLRNEYSKDGIEIVKGERFLRELYS
ncbi:MAG TPA: ATP-binding protein [Spirochaetota bacterium]|nr:ATP-binding protein [Spirochaetota bacterium]